MDWGSNVDGVDRLVDDVLSDYGLGLWVGNLVADQMRMGDLYVAKRQSDGLGVGDLDVQGLGMKSWNRCGLSDLHVLGMNGWCMMSHVMAQTDVMRFWCMDHLKFVYRDFSLTSIYQRLIHRP